MEAWLSGWAGLNFSTLPEQLTVGIMIGAIYALIALGYTMVYGVLRLINFAHGEVFMLGAYTALFSSWILGYTPAIVNSGKAQPSTLTNLLIMLVTSMVVCAVIGAIIEFLAYRPMRNQSRISALITAIGVSMLLQYGGQLFFPSIQQNIQQEVNPYKGTYTLTLKAAPEQLRTELAAAQSELKVEDEKFKAVLASGEDEFNLSAQGKAVRDAMQAAEREVKEAQGKVNQESVTISVPFGQVVVFITTVVLMAGLTFLVLKTPVGRAMRAVSHDFDSASLMGINVNRIITFTFMIGSALAGAGAMMNATFFGTAISPFYGVALGVKAFVAAVLGGIGNIPGAVLGGLLMGVAETLVVWAGYSGYKDAIAFVVLIVVLLFKPGGLLGSAKVEKV